MTDLDMPDSEVLLSFSTAFTNVYQHHADSYPAEYLQPFEAAVTLCAFALQINLA